MRTLTEIGEALVGVYGDNLSFFHIPDELQLVGLAGEQLHGLLSGHLAAHKGLVSLDALPHASFDLPQVLRR